MAGHQDGRLLDLMLAFDLECRMIAAEGSLHSEIDLNHLVLRFNQAHPARLRPLVSSGVHPDDRFVDEASVTGVEEVPEILPELFKDKIDDLCLHLGRELLVKFKLLHNQIVIIFERLFNRFNDAQIKISRNIKVPDSRVGLL